MLSSCLIEGDVLLRKPSSLFLSDAAQETMNALVSTIESMIQIRKHGEVTTMFVQRFKRRCRGVTLDRKSVVQGKSVELGGRRIIKKKKNKILTM